MSTESDALSDTGADTEAGGETTLTVVIAFFANLAIAVSKTLVAMGTGSASMVAESAHSWADTGNQVLLYIADRRSRRAPDESHPFGYGREAYVWSMLAAVGLFAAGAVVSVYSGATKLVENSEEASYTWAYIVLGLSFVFEGISFTQALRQTRREAHDLERHTIEHALRTSDPTLRAVFAEDSAALIGLALATLGVFLHQVTGDAVYDAIGSILVGLLLGVIAVVLINQNRRFLTGEQTDARLRDATIARLKEMPEIDRVTYLRLDFLGPRKVLLVASVDVSGEQPETQLAYTLRELEERIEEDKIVVDAILSLSIPEDPSL